MTVGTLRPAKLIPPTPDQQRALIDYIVKVHGMSRDEAIIVARKNVEKEDAAEVWRSDFYQVMIYRGDQVPIHADGWPRMIWLSIKRIDKAPIHDWRDLQEIKNQLIGPSHEAIELYPNESRLVDTANQYHLWVLEEPGSFFPFGWTSREVTDHIDGMEDATGARQRPLADGVARTTPAQPGGTALSHLKGR